jgi:two-component system sensor kinase FixL
MNDQDMTILREALENTEEAFVTIDEHHTVVLFNRAAEMIFGTARAEILGRDLNSIMTPECSANHRRALDAYLQAKTPRGIRHRSELEITRPGGEKIPVAISFSVAETGGRRFFTGILRDLTESKALEQKVDQSERLAALGRFVAEISHEIRNPLMVIGIAVQQIWRRLGDETSRGKLKIVEDEVRKLEKLINELNSYYRPRTMNTEIFDANSLVAEVCSLTRPECEARRVKLECRTDEGPILIEGDRSKLEEVLLNLIRNALEAIRDEGRLSIRSSVTDRAEIRVSDNGPGIPKEIRANIFSPFFTTKGKGSGLGLAISKRIIDAHPGWTIEFSSEDGRGTEFKISMPLVRPANPAPGCA